MLGIWDCIANVILCFDRTFVAMSIDGKLTEVQKALDATETCKKEIAYQHVHPRLCTVPVGPPTIMWPIPLFREVNAWAQDL